MLPQYISYNYAFSCLLSAEIFFEIRKYHRFRPMFSLFGTPYYSLVETRSYSILFLAFTASLCRVTEENFLFETVQSGPKVYFVNAFTAGSDFSIFICNGLTIILFGRVVLGCICTQPFNSANKYKKYIYYSKKVLHHQIFTKIYKYHFFLSTTNLNFKFDTALEDSIQYLTQQ